MNFFSSSSSSSSLPVAPLGRDTFKMEAGLDPKALAVCPFYVLNHPPHVLLRKSSSMMTAGNGGKSSKGKRSSAPGKSSGSVSSLAPRSKQYSMDDPVPFMQIPKGIANKEYIIEGFGNINTYLTTSVAIDSFAAATPFTLNTFVNQVSSLTAVFDQYKVLKLEYWFNPRVTPSSFTAAATNLGRYVFVLDYDDSSALASFAAGTDYATALLVPGGTCVYQQFVPHVAVAYYAGGVFTSFGNETAPWIDAASPGVEHYGVKIAHTVTSQVFIYDLALRYTVAFRNTR